MAVNIKNERVERLLDEVAALTGETKTEAIRRSLEERRDRLARHATGNPADRLRRLLEREIWPAIPAELRGTRLSKSDEEQILGYGPDGA
jgi:antitoxin VapB